MNLSTPFIRRPVATCLMMLAILLAGMVAFRFLSLSALPEVDFPTIQVQTFYPGASPEVMATTVTAPLEVQMGQMSDLARMTSTSSAGSSAITLQFNLDLPLDVAEQEVQAAINAAASLMPTDLPAPPVYAKVNPADAPVLTLALTSTTLPLTEVEGLADQRIAQKISQMRGVGLVSLSGGQRPAVRIQADSRALASRGLSLASVATAIAQANANGAKGSLDGPSRAWSIDVNDQLLTPADYANQIIAWRDGAGVRLKDVARVTAGAENTRLGALWNVTPAVLVNVQRQPGANVIQTVDAIRQALPDLAAALPVGVRMVVASDRTSGIRASVRDVEFELVLAVALVVAVIFLFLRSLPATFIASVAAPLALVGTFGAMYLLHFSLNNLTLMALTIATGFVVDDAIVMLENIARHVEAGESPMAAALKGAGQIGFTIVSLTVSLIAVLIPLLFMSDVVGRLFRQFAITLTATILISSVVSLTLVPTLAARWLRPAAAGRPGALTERARTAMEIVTARYDRALAWVLDRQGPTLIVAVATLAVTVILYAVIPKALFPTQDTGLVQGVITADQSISFDGMAALQKTLARHLLADPAVDSLTGFSGADGTNPTLNSGRMLIRLKPRGAGRGSLPTVLDRLRSDADSVPGARLWLLPVQDLTIDAAAGRTQYQFALQGADRTKLVDASTRLTGALRSDPHLRHVVSDVQDEGLAALVRIDRDSAARLGITAATIDDTLYSALGQRIVSTIFTQSSQQRVILEADPAAFNSPGDLAGLYVPTPAGASTPLGAVAQVTTAAAPLEINHAGQFPAVNIGFDTAPNVALGTAVRAIDAAERRIGTPAGVSTVFLGAANALNAALANELWLILAAIVTVYIVLGVLYESFVHPVTILSTLPSAGVGALAALMIAGHPLDVIAIIGLVLLIGIVKKNAIMMIDFALDAQRTQGRSAREAIHQAAVLRLRPILMTTFAAIFAALPLMLGWGDGSELRHPLGLAIVGGLLVSQVLTLFTTPVIYLRFDALARRFGGGRGGPRAGPAAEPAA